MSLSAPKLNHVNNMNIISASTEEQSAANEEIAAASQALSKMAEDMQDAVGQFRI